MIHQRSRLQRRFLNVSGRTPYFHKKLRDDLVERPRDYWGRQRGCEIRERAPSGHGPAIPRREESRCGDALTSTRLTRPSPADFAPVNFAGAPLDRPIPRSLARPVARSLTQSPTRSPSRAPAEPPSGKSNRGRRPPNDASAQRGGAPTLLVFAFVLSLTILQKNLPSHPLHRVANHPADQASTAFKLA